MLVVIAGIVLMLYPYISEYFFENRVDSEIMAYKECINKTVDQQYQRMLEQAEEYNSYLQKSQMQLTDPFANTGGTDLFMNRCFGWMIQELEDMWRYRQLV